MAKLINKTPHDVVVFNIFGEKVVFKAEGSPIRVSSEEKMADCINNIRIADTDFGEIENLPEEVNGVYYIVSRQVLAAGLKIGRKDLLAPAGHIRDEHGQTCGCTHLARS